MVVDGPSNRILGLLLLTVLLACAGQRRAPGSGEEMVMDTIEIEVENDFALNRTLSVRIINGNGFRQLLGTVTPGNTESFTYRAPRIAQRYQLIAQDGSQIVQRSNPFPIQARGTILWRVARNTVVIKNGQRNPS